MNGNSNFSSTFSSFLLLHHWCPYMKVFAYRLHALAAIICAGTTGLISACGSDKPQNPIEPTSVTETTTTTTTDAISPTPSAASMQAMYAKFNSDVQVLPGGSTYTLQSTGQPDHASPYWGSGNALYEEPHAGMRVNPNLILPQDLTLYVPAVPAIGTASDTPMSAIGMALNGVPFYNQYAAGQQPLTAEIESFDHYNGHPDQTGSYHYHLEPLFLTQTSGSSLVGVLLDGFPVYGPQDSDGSTPTDLDVCNGHVGVTRDFPETIYHYHTTEASPYISGCFKGTPGTVG